MVIGGPVAQNLTGHDMNFKFYFKFNKTPLKYVKKGVIFLFQPLQREQVVGAHERGEVPLYWPDVTKDWSSCGGGRRDQFMLVHILKVELKEFANGFHSRVEMKLKNER